MADLIDRDTLREAMRDCESVTHSIGYSDMIAIIDDANAINRWIPCIERLPETGVDVIVYWQGLLIKIAHLMHDYLWETSDGEYDLPAKDVTHWMPLPEPPGGADNG